MNTHCLKKIRNPGEKIIYERDYATNGAVYIGGIYYLVRANEDLKWRKDEKGYNILSLKDISDQLDARLITVFEELPLEGHVYQYGNYGAEWWEIGELAGYA